MKFFLNFFIKNIFLSTFSIKKTLFLLTVIFAKKPPYCIFCIKVKGEYHDRS